MENNMFLLYIFTISVLFSGSFLFTCCPWVVPANTKVKRNAADYWQAGV